MVKRRGKLGPDEGEPGADGPPNEAALPPQRPTVRLMKFAPTTPPGEPTAAPRIERPPTGAGSPGPRADAEPVSQPVVPPAASRPVVPPAPSRPVVPPAPSRPETSPPPSFFAPVAPVAPAAVGRSDDPTPAGPEQDVPAPAEGDIASPPEADEPVAPAEEEVPPVVEPADRPVTGRVTSPSAEGSSPSQLPAVVPAPMLAGDSSPPDPLFDRLLYNGYGEIRGAWKAAVLLACAGLPLLVYVLLSGGGEEDVVAAQAPGVVTTVAAVETVADDPPATAPATTTTAAPTTTSAPAPTTVPAPSIPPADLTQPPVEAMGVYSQGRVVLTGSVPTAELARAYEERAASVIGEENVTNELTLDPRVSAETIMIDVEENFVFPSGSVLYDEDFDALLTLGVFALQLLPEATLVIEGHTDSIGDRATNQALSVARASLVVDFMVRGGIPRERLVVRGKGQDEPIADNATPEGRQANRRIEAQLEGITPYPPS
jgi:outer membrane protein OmpA-like peptidoglycan-associated protein